MELRRGLPQKNHHAAHTVAINSKHNPECSPTTELNTHSPHQETNLSPPKSTSWPNPQKNQNSPTSTSTSATCFKPENSSIYSSAMQITSKGQISRTIATSQARSLRSHRPRGVPDRNHRSMANSSRGMSHPPWEWGPNLFYNIFRSDCFDSDDAGCFLASACFL